jgi:hypothetical protein
LRVRAIFEAVLGEISCVVSGAVPGTRSEASWQFSFVACADRMTEGFDRLNILLTSLRDGARITQ